MTVKCTRVHEAPCVGSVLSCPALRGRTPRHGEGGGIRVSSPSFYSQIIYMYGQMSEQYVHHTHVFECFQDNVHTSIRTCTNG